MHQQIETSKQHCIVSCKPTFHFCHLRIVRLNDVALAYKFVLRFVWILPFNELKQWDVDAIGSVYKKFFRDLR